jgi:hypothetical protein
MAAKRKGAPPRALATPEATKLEVARLVEAGEVEAAIRVSGGKDRATVYRWRDAAKVAGKLVAAPAPIVAPAPPAEPPTPVLAPGSPTERLRAYATHDTGALAVLDDLLADDAPEAEIATRERVVRLIRRTERRFDNAGAGRDGPLGSLLDRLYARLAKLDGPPPPRPDAVEELYRGLDADALTIVEQHLADRIEPQEVRA